MAQGPGEGQRKAGLTRRRALAAGLGTGAGAWALSSGTAAAEAASATTFDPTGLQLVTAGNVQDALEQVDARLEGTLGGPGVINVRDYGAVGDGVTNDVPALIDALFVHKPTNNPLDWIPRFDPNVGGVIYFPPGIYSLSLMMIWFSRVNVVGAGAGRTTLLFRQTANPPDLDFAGKLWLTDQFREQRISDVSVQDMTIRTDLLLGTNDARDSGDTALKVFQVDGVRISGVEVVDSPSSGISIWDCTDVVVDNCHVHDTHLDGIHLESVTRGVIQACRVDHVGDDGISIGGENDPGAALSTQVVVSSNVISRSGANGISIWGSDGVVLSDNTISGTHQVGIGLNVNDLPRHTRNVVIRGNHIDGTGLYGEDTDVLWGAGIPYAIAVGPSDGGADNLVEVVLVEGNLVDDCRNGYVLVEKANDVKVAGNLLYGPITTAQPAAGSHQRVGSLGQGPMLPPTAPYAGGSTSVFPAVRVRGGRRVRLDNNVVKPAANERSFLIEGPTVAEVVRVRVSDNSIDRGSSAPLGSHGVEEIAVTPAGVVVNQGGNDVNGLALAPASTPA